MSVAMSSKTAATYQSIIIALVAAGLIGIGTMTLVYKRRRRRDFLRAVQSGRIIRQPGMLGNRWVQLSDGQMVELRSNEVWGLTEGEVGRQPEIWDSIVSGQKPKMETNDYSEESEKEDVLLKNWSPMCLVSSTPPKSPKSTQVSNSAAAPNCVEISVLITMPDEHTEQLPSYRPIDEEEQIPAVSIASTSLPIYIPPAKQGTWDAIQNDLKNHRVAAPEQSLESGGIRRVRADGFRS